MVPAMPGTERRRSSRPRDAERCCVDDLGMVPAARANEVPWWVVGVCAHARDRSGGQTGAWGDVIGVS